MTTRRRNPTTTKMEILCDRQNTRGVSSLNSDQDLRFGPLVYGSTLPLSVGIVDRISSPSGSRIWQPLDISAGTLKAAIGRGFALPIAGSFRLINGAQQTAGPLVSGKTYLILTFVAGDDFANVGAAANASGEFFTASGTTPTIWANGSALQDVTSELAYDCSAVDIAAALNLLPSIIASGGVTVSGATGFFTISFVAAGPQLQIYGDAANLAPLSLVDAGTLINGSVDPVLREVQSIQIVQDAGTFVNLTTASAAAAVTVTEVQAGGGGANAQYRVTLSPSPYDGGFTLTLRGHETSFLAWNAAASDVVAALAALSQTSGLLVSGARYKIVTFAASDDFTNVGAASNATGVVFTASGTTPTNWAHGSTLSPVAAGNVEANQETTGQWLIQFIGDMADTDMGTVTGSAAGLLVIPEKSGTLDLRTSGCALILGQSDTAPVVLEIQYTPSGGTPEIVFRSSQTLIMPVIKPASGTPTPREGFYDKTAVDALFAALFRANPAVTVSTAGNTNLSKAAAVEKYSVYLVSAGAGAGGYTRTLALTIANAGAGDLAKIRVDFAARVNPTVEIRNATADGTLLFSAMTGSGSAFSWTALAQFDGAAWQPLTNG